MERGRAPAVAAMGLTPIGSLPATQRLDLVIVLPLRNREALTNLLEDLCDLGSPHRGHYLTPQEFALRFGPTEQDYDAVSTFAQGLGLAATGTHPNRTLLVVSGSVADIEQAFNVNMLHARHTPRLTGATNWSCFWCLWWQGAGWNAG